jgi:hypothetical protein
MNSVHKMTANLILGHLANSPLEKLSDSICRQGKDIGIHFYIYSGGEPLVRKADIIRLCDAHPVRKEQLYDHCKADLLGQRRHNRSAAGGSRGDVALL